MDTDQGQETLHVHVRRKISAKWVVVAILLLIFLVVIVTFGMQSFQNQAQAAKHQAALVAEVDILETQVTHLGTELEQWQTRAAASESVLIEQEDVLGEQRATIESLALLLTPTATVQPTQTPTPLPTPTVISTPTPVGIAIETLEFIGDGSLYIVEQCTSGTWMVVPPGCAGIGLEPVR